MMTRKHYQAFAQELADYMRFSQDTPERTREFTTFAARIFAAIDGRDNPRFDHERSMRARGLS